MPMRQNFPQQSQQQQANRFPQQQQQQANYPQQQTQFPQHANFPQQNQPVLPAGFLPAGANMQDQQTMALIYKVFLKTNFY